jgi:branched-chain amino acid transport system ATP-binding protein
VSAEPILIMSGVSKHFGGLVAVRDLSLTTCKGRIYGLIGPNGAGKTTVFNLITGVHTCTKGSIVSENTDLTLLKPYAITRIGLARTFQTIRLFKNMTVWEHVLVGQSCLTGSGRKANHPQGHLHKKGLEDEARGILDLLGLWELRERQASTLSYGIQRKVEMARALSTRPKLLLLDEPTAGLNIQETNDLLKRLATIHEKGVTLLIIEHDMKVIMEFCDHIFVLNFGEKIAEGAPAHIRAHEQVIECYLGREK